MDSIKIVDAVVANDKEAFMSAFTAAISDKVTDALELKKVELATTMLVSPEELETTTEISNEVEGTQTEVDGSDAVESADSAG